MNILHISPYVPSVHATHAGGVCMGKELEYLRQTHNVFVLSFVNDEREEQIVQKEFKGDKQAYFVRSTTFSKGANALKGLNNPVFFSIRNSRQFKKYLMQILKENKIDAIHAEYTAMSQHVWIKKYYPNIQFNVVEHDVTKQSYDRYAKDSTGFKHLYYQWQANLVTKCEKYYLSQCDLIFTLNKKDKRLLNQYYGFKNVETIMPYYGVDFTNVKESIPREKKSICFVGLMNRLENHEAAMRLIQIVKSLPDKDIKLNIIGAHPNDELKSQESNQVHITGFVESIEDEILKNEIAVFPLMLGAGIKLKVLLSAGLGLPVITTSIGAEGIDEDGEYVSLAESDDEFKTLILKYIDDESFRKEKAQKIKEYIIDGFNWSKTESIFDKIYQ